MNKKYIDNSRDSNFYNLVVKLLGNNGSETLDLIMENAYQKGREDLAEELRPEVIIKYGIFASNREKGIIKIKELVGNKPVILEYYGVNEVMVKCIDSEYRLLPFNDNARGNKLHYAYVDKELVVDDASKEMLECRVRPMLILAFITFGKDKMFNRNNHLIYFDTDDY